MITRTLDLKGHKEYRIVYQYSRQRPMKAIVVKNKSNESLYVHIATSRRESEETKLKLYVEKGGNLTVERPDKNIYLTSGKGKVEVEIYE